MKKHIEVVHLKLKPFECNLSDKAFPHKYSVTKHKQRVHEMNSQDKNRKSDQCDYKTLSNQALPTHINSVHLKIRLFNCEACGENFVQNHNIVVKQVPKALETDSISHCGCN